MSRYSFTPESPELQDWDVVVVGTGMGGGVVGYELARRGHRVVFLERGLALHGDVMNPEGTDDAADEESLRGARWPHHLVGRTNFGEVSFMAPRGCGTGGSTALYSAQLERFRNSDFSPRAWYPNAIGTTLPERWPVSHETMTPYYRYAEELFAVQGTQDPLEPDAEAMLAQPSPISERDRALCAGFIAAGLHPYRSHVGIAKRNSCLGCEGICKFDCKSDAGNRCVVPALMRHGASIVTRCKVQRVLTDGRRVTGVAVRWLGHDLMFRGKIVVLAAGAWSTPLLLMRSGAGEGNAADWLANSSGMLGRNLMLHTTDLAAVDPGEALPEDGARKALTMNDFYDDEGNKLGTFQAVGHRLDRATVAALVASCEDRDPAQWSRSVHGFADRISRMATRKFRRARLMATIMEDLPYPENRVLPAADTPDGMRFDYTYTEELLARNARFRRRLHEVLSPRMAVHFVPLGDNNLNYGHVCGTCRFGDDPRTSVLDATNRAHDLDNLYVTDASFFPSSGATNPSLTIAANAVRVAEHIHQRL